MCPNMAIERHSKITKPVRASMLRMVIERKQHTHKRLADLALSCAVYFLDVRLPPPIMDVSDFRMRLKP